jgi:hypothetical protein
LHRNLKSDHVVRIQTSGLHHRNLKSETTVKIFVEIYERPKIV